MIFVNEVGESLAHNGILTSIGSAERPDPVTDRGHPERWDVNPTVDLTLLSRWGSGVLMRSLTHFR
ncbi:hypothetical protein JOE57_003455 [Microlunatus panaciterrae]|uniref:Uncharacterized protein n=1 Tax=Microlunatus panaciterrae TaxID=400768 RepID=A0ABS2RNF4_9ACTN|nr:hypothetical protein [Microlunatus panaciterrae]